MKKTLLTAALTACTLLAGQVFAADMSCADKAADKKLAGAAKTSFMKKCERDAAPKMSAACTKAAADKKLAGAAKNSFVKKCSADEAASAAK